MIAARIHAQRKRFGVSERAGKQRHNKRSHHGNAPFGSLAEICATTNLRTVDSAQFDGELGQEAQSDSHHHRQLMSGQSEAFEGL